VITCPWKYEYTNNHNNNKKQQQKLKETLPPHVLKKKLQSLCILSIWIYSLHAPSKADVFKQCHIWIR
jgi:hypothetical protein